MSQYDEQIKQAIPAEFHMISGSHDSQTSWVPHVLRLDCTGKAENVSCLELLYSLLFTEPTFTMSANSIFPMRRVVPEERVLRHSSKCCTAEGMWRAPWVGCSVCDPCEPSWIAWALIRFRSWQAVVWLMWMKPCTLFRRARRVDVGLFWCKVLLESFWKGISLCWQWYQLHGTAGATFGLPQRCTKYQTVHYQSAGISRKRNLGSHGR